MHVLRYMYMCMNMFEIRRERERDGDNLYLSSECAAMCKQNGSILLHCLLYHIVLCIQQTIATLYYIDVCVSLY